MTEVIGIKFEENGMVEYVIPDRHYAKDDFVVVLEKKGQAFGSGGRGEY